MYVCMYACVWFNKSKTAQPIKLKFFDMLPIVLSQVLGKKWDFVDWIIHALHTFDLMLHSQIIDHN